MSLYKNFLIAVISLILFFLSSISIINYYIDPGNQFFRSQKFEEKLANHLLANQDVMIRFNYNARLLKKIILAKIKARPDFLIIGSSRVMLMNHHLFNTPSFYNTWVPLGATIQDDIAIYYLFQKRGWGPPKTVLICLDTWILSRNNGKEAWKVFFPEYMAAKKLFLNDRPPPRFYEQWSETVNKYTQLLSIDYLTASFNKMNESRQIKSHSLIEDILVSSNPNDCPTCDIEHPDGSRTLSMKKELTTREEADVLGRKSIIHTRYNNSYTELDPDYTKLFEDFIHYLLSKNVHVILYLPPYEPAAYYEIQNDPNYKMIPFSELYFRSIASKYHLEIIGSYNPDQLRLRADDFVDDMHLKEKGVWKIFNNKFDLKNT